MSRCYDNPHFADEETEALSPSSAVSWRRKWHPTPVLLPGKSHGRRSLVGYSPWGHEESDMTERLHFHFSLSCIGEGNGNPLQCSCLENPRDRGAWWAAICGVAQRRTRLKQLSSSSSSPADKWQAWGLNPESVTFAEQQGLLGAPLYKSGGGALVPHYTK